jgi:hypothetical protein
MGILNFLSRNARVAVVIAIGLGALSAAGAIGWLTAPTG